MKEFATTHQNELTTVTNDLMDLYYNNGDYKSYLEDSTHAYEKDIILNGEYPFTVNFIDEDNTLLYCEYIFGRVDSNGAFK